MNLWKKGVFSKGEGGKFLALVILFFYVKWRRIKSESESSARLGMIGNGERFSSDIPLDAIS
jgi:hypothetical protein